MTRGISFVLFSTAIAATSMMGHPKKISYLSHTAKPEEYICSARQEDIFIAIQNFESIFEKHQDEILQKMNAVPEAQRIFAESDTEGKFFNIYALLRLSGAIEKFDWRKPQFVEFDIVSKTFQDKPQGRYAAYKQFSSAEEYKKIWVSEDGKRIRIPKFTFNKNFKGKILHLGDFVDRGRNSVPGFLTMLYAKEQLGDKCHLIVGNHELYPDLPHKTVEENVYSRIEYDLVSELTQHYWDQKKMKFFDTILIGGKPVLLTHVEISAHLTASDQFYDVFEKRHGVDFFTDKDFLDNIESLETTVRQKVNVNLEKWYRQWLEDIPGNVNDENKSIFISQMCGHLHHPVEADKIVKANKSGQINTRKGYFFKKDDKTILYLDNYSTTSDIGGLFGFSKADIHLIDAGKELNGDTVFRFVDKDSDNFKIFP